MKQLFIIVFTLSFSQSLSAIPTQGLKSVGTGTMSWLFWDLYQITLYSSDGHYQNQEYPQALSIQYLKDIDKADLITATKEQWGHLNINWQPQWLEHIERLWPNIKKNDNLTLLILENGNSQFYYNQAKLGNIDDHNFSKAFIAIWLSPNTSEPELREQLINRPLNF